MGGIVSAHPSVHMLDQLPADLCTLRFVQRIELQRLAGWKHYF